MPDDKGVWKGLDVDTARAIAAAVFGAHRCAAVTGPTGQRN
jgi:general L-amino acid transport system substrate-binding protein